MTIENNDNPKSRIVGHIAPQPASRNLLATLPEMPPRSEPERPTLAWQWSPDAIEAFMATAFAEGRKAMRVGEGLNAAMGVDGPAIFHRQIDVLITTLGTDPVLSGRVLKLRPNADDGLCYLKVDMDLVRFVILNSLDPAIDARILAEGLDEQAIGEATADIAREDATATEEPV